MDSKIIKELEIMSTLVINLNNESDEVVAEINKAMPNDQTMDLQGLEDLVTDLYNNADNK